METLESPQSITERISELVIENEEILKLIEGLLQKEDYKGAREELDSLLEKVFAVDSLEWTGGLLAGKQFPGALEMHHGLVTKIREDMRQEKENNKRIYIHFDKPWPGVDPIEFEEEDIASLAYVYVRQLKEMAAINRQLSYVKNLYSSHSRIMADNPRRAGLYDYFSNINGLDVYRDLSEVPEEHRV